MITQCLDLTAPFDLLLASYIRADSTDLTALPDLLVAVLTLS